MRRLNTKGNLLTKRKYNKKNNQIHIHNICFAMKEGETLKVDIIETEVVDESRSIKKINTFEI